MSPLVAVAPPLLAVLVIAGVLWRSGIVRRYPHRWSEEFTIGGGPDYEAVDSCGQPTGIVIHPVSRRLRVCQKCGSTDAIAIVRPWCTEP